ncbi:UDP-2,3-diacylglucosamine diphosphatase [Pigmentiphaga soli]|uniref:UDP-2,3-diacylglucosamine diphosphatase n=1 Tax=Pigmentiphaga soli TaxID=1007095 RepID=UPI0031E8A197
MPLIAPPGPVWLASDLHLGEAAPATVEAFLAFLELAAAEAGSLLLPGDVFDAWVGDDELDQPAPWLAAVAAGLKAAGARLPIYLGPGNRDFLMGQRLAQATGTRLLPDPAILETEAGRFLLCHGDALCTDDAAYQQFRQMVRDPRWQAQFLSRPLAERQAMAREMRARSTAEKSRKASDIMDVNPQAVEDALRAAGVARLIHGHTHRPGRHAFLLDGRPAERLVLPDWDLDDASQPRGGWLAIDRDGAAFCDVAVDAPVAAGRAAAAG